jgi:mono/diheme cytochrome c family protein
MVDNTRKLVLIFIGAFVVEHAAMLIPSAKRAAFPPYEQRATAGRRIVERLGCFTCHGPEGRGGVANPGSEDGVVPALVGPDVQAWASSEDELRHWILEGVAVDAAPYDRLAGLNAGGGSDRAIVMPAYREMLAPGEIDDVVAYLASVSTLRRPAQANVAAGLERMHALGCFRCHGPMGVGGAPNPRSLKGYVPGFGGPDYEEIVASNAELREWIRDGVSERFARNPLARAVMGAQAIKMPAYGRFLNNGDLESITAAVEWIASGAWKIRSFEADPAAQPLRRTDGRFSGLRPAS